MSFCFSSDSIHRLSDLSRRRSIIFCFASFTLFVIVSFVCFLPAALHDFRYRCFHLLRSIVFTRRPSSSPPLVHHFVRLCLLPFDLFSVEIFILFIFLDSTLVYCLLPLFHCSIQKTSNSSFRGPSVVVGGCVFICFF